MIARAPLGEILRHLRAEPSRTWSVIITVFGDAIVPRGGSVWLGTLVRFFAALGSNDGVVRTAMSRLAADGWLERSRVGRNSFYHLTEKGRVTFRQATAHIYGAHARHWNGRFEMLLIGNTRERESARPQLLTAGFGAVAPGVWVAPAGAPVPRLACEVLHLDAGCDLATARTLAKACWPLERTAAAYARFLTLFTPFEERSTRRCRPRRSMPSLRGSCSSTSTVASSCAIPRCRSSCCPRPGREWRRASSAAGFTIASCRPPSVGSTGTVAVQPASSRPRAPNLASASEPMRRNTLQIALTPGNFCYMFRPRGRAGRARKRG